MTAKVNVGGVSMVFNEETKKWEIESWLKDLPKVKGLRRRRASKLLLKYNEELLKIADMALKDNWTDDWECELASILMEK